MKNDNIHTLEKGDVWIEDIELTEDLKELCIAFGAYFDMYEKFALQQYKDDENTVVNLYGEYSLIDQNFVLHYRISSDEKEEYLSYYPTAEEKTALINEVEKYCQKKYDMNCYNFYLHTYSTNYAKTIDLVCEKADKGYQVRNTADDFILFKSNDGNMARFIGHNIDLVSYGNDETYSIESLDSCEVIFSTDALECEVQEDDEEMEM